MLARLACGKARRKIGKLEEALAGAEFFTAEHAVLLKVMLERIDQLTAAIPLIQLLRGTEASVTDDGTATCRASDNDTGRPASGAGRLSSHGRAERRLPSRRCTSFSTLLL